MSKEPIPEDVKRFILTSLISVPHLEATLLLRDQTEFWDSKRVAQRLYTSEKMASVVLADLCAAGILVVTGQETLRYRYQPSSGELREMIDRVATVYARHLIEVANLIHSKTSKNARQFADAFKLRED